MIDVRVSKLLEESAVLGWRAWSVWDGKIVRVAARSPEAWSERVPPEGFQVWVLYYNRRLPDPLGLDRKIIHGYDYYFMAPGLGDWVYGFTNKEQDLAAYPEAVVKYGRSVDEVIFQKIRDEVEAATELSGGKEEER